jgi:hypothetical protein
VGCFDTATQWRATAVWPRHTGIECLAEQWLGHILWLGHSRYTSLVRAFTLSTSGPKLNTSSVVGVRRFRIGM